MLPLQNASIVECHITLRSLCRRMKKITIRSTDLQLSKKNWVRRDNDTFKRVAICSISSVANWSNPFLSFFPQAFLRIKMHSSLRIFQITLIITQITTVESFFLNVTSTASTVLTYSTVTSAGSPVKSMQTTAVSPTSNVTSSSLQPSKTSDVQSSSTLTVSSTTNVFSVTGTETIAASPESTVNASLSETSTTSIVSSSSLQAAGSLMTTAHVTSSTEQLTKVGNISATLSKLLTSKQLESSVPGNTTKTGSQTNIVSITTSMEPATTTTNAISVASTEATNLSPSGLLTSQTQSITANYLLSSASRRTSIVLTTAESKQTLTTSLAGIDREHERRGPITGSEYPTYR